MPSAGRAFTPILITRLVANGVRVVPLILHTGVASLEDDEPPYEEFYRVPPETAAAINVARTADRRVIAVGTTVVRALETVTDRDGKTHPGEGWTDVFITPSGTPGSGRALRGRSAARRAPWRAAPRPPTRARPSGRRSTSRAASRRTGRARRAGAAAARPRARTRRCR